MHAFLIEGGNQEQISTTIDGLLKNLKVKKLEFPLAKIDDTRALNSFLKLRVTAPTAIIINSIEKATDEAANAFLKNLEEPQEDLYYILTTESTHSLLPTIVSRCQVIKIVHGSPSKKANRVSKFLEMTTGEKLVYLDQIKDRDEAKLFARDLINYFHSSIHLEKDNLADTADNIELSQKILRALESNGNVSLQLTNLAINLK